ncbi:hypothetical protein F4703DRAFT_1840259, partial [Phycomyces blakesleeanus]
MCVYATKNRRYIQINSFLYTFCVNTTRALCIQFTAFSLSLSNKHLFIPSHLAFLFLFFFSFPHSNACSLHLPSGL